MSQPRGTVHRPLAINVSFKYFWDVKGICLPITPLKQHPVQPFSHKSRIKAGKLTTSASSWALVSVVVATIQRQLFFIWSTRASSFIFWMLLIIIQRCVIPRPEKRRLNFPPAMYFFTLQPSKVKFVLFLGVRSTNPLPAASGLVKLIMCLCSPSLCNRTLPARAAWRHKGTEREQWSWSQSSSQHLQVFSKLCTFTHIAKIWLHTASVFYSNELLYGLVGAAK